jgi:large subunit ribosomal protein L10
MKSRAQKEQEVAQGKTLAKDAQAVIFVNFSQTSVNLLHELKKGLREINGVFKVMKKTLFDLVFKESNMEVSTQQFQGQIGTVFCKEDMVDAAGTVYRFTKEHKNELPTFAMVGGFDVATGTFYDADKMMELGKLPSRDVLLAQLLGMLQAPVRSFAVVLQQIADQKSSGESSQTESDSTQQAEEVSAPEAEQKDEEHTDSSEQSEPSKEEDAAPAEDAAEETTAPTEESSKEEEEEIKEK